MNNSFFLYSEDDINIERFHICTWDFNNNDSLVEFGIEIKADSLTNIKKEIKLKLYVSWLNNNLKVEDFYDKLKESRNSKFIFNDSISNTFSLDGGDNKLGVIHEFSERNKLCILPINCSINNKDKSIEIKLNTNKYYELKEHKNVNIYLRLGLEVSTQNIVVEKGGIAKSTILYDIKLNEKRNIPSSLDEKKLKRCEINYCFCFHIIPNNYNITFVESKYLKKIRTLEFEPFKEYLEDERIKPNELIVIFSKKQEKDSSYSFFSIYTKEKIGILQIIIAIIINIITTILLSFQISYKLHIISIIVLFLLIYIFFQKNISHLLSKILKGKNINKKGRYKNKQ